MDLARLRLQEHLGDAGSRAEVTIDLKRRMRVEKVGVDAAALAVVNVVPRARNVQQVTQQEVRMITIQQPRPEVDAPCHRPPGGLVAARGQGDLRGGGQVRRRHGRNLASRMKREEVRDVAMFVADIIAVLRPFL